MANANSKNRIREALQAEPVRQLATFATSVPALPSGPEPDPDLKGDVLGVFDKSAGTSSGVSGGAVSAPAPPQAREDVVHLSGRT